MVGSSRSGTTWLAKILDSYPGVYYSHEPLSKLQTPEFQQLVGRIVSQGKLSLEEQRQFDCILRTANPRCVHLPFFPKRHNRWSPAVIAAAYASCRSLGVGRSLFAKLASPDVDESLQLLIKEVEWAIHLPSIIAALNPKMIFIIRHPCAVVSSIVQGQRLGVMPLSDIPTWYQEHTQICSELSLSEREITAASPLEFAAIQWVVHNTLYFRLHQLLPDSIWIVYRNLVTDPLGTTTRLFDAMNWEVGHTTRDFVSTSTSVSQTANRSLFRSRAGRYFSVQRNPQEGLTGWKRRLTADEFLKIRDIVERFPWRNYWPAEAFEF